MERAEIKSWRHWPTICGAAFIVVATFLIYLRAITGGMIWDDPQHITQNETLRTASGLIEMWTVPRSLPQWYPLVHTTFWLEYHCWGISPLGYHIDNVLLHIVVSLLLWRVLRVLQIPGAWLAAAIFAVHPVQVETAAWITERKNLLSAVFYLLALLSYWRFLNEPGKKWGVYSAALIFFVAALFSKTVTATLPATILVILWWKRGKIRVRDVWPLVPFFILGISLGLFTAYLEKTHVGATGERIAELNLSLLDRVLIAGRVIWFYAGKIVWPARLSFIYPRWNVDPHIWWQWIFPIALICVIVALVLSRKRMGRGVLAAVLIYCGTLFPVLGFLNVYPMRFSFVADHFQYHAAMALIALIAAILWKYEGVYAYAVLLPLIALTAMRTPVYHDAITLWRDTLAKNPDSWMVQTNLGHVLRSKGEETNDEKYFALAEQHYWRALELAPQIHDTETNVGSILGRRGQYAEALVHFQRALKVDPNFAPAYYSIGQVYQATGKPDLAIENYRKALAIAPFYAEAHYRLGTVFESQNAFAAAADEYRAAVGERPDDPQFRYNLGTCLIKMHQYNEAIANLLEAVKAKPNFAQAWFNLGAAQAKIGRREDAIQSLHRALELDPSLQHPH